MKFVKLGLVAAMSLAAVAPAAAATPTSSAEKLRISAPMKDANNLGGGTLTGVLYLALAVAAVIGAIELTGDSDSPVSA